MKVEIDQVTLTVIDNAIGTICMEMAAAMRRTAYSPIFNEGLDFTCVMFDRHGELIGQAEMNPADRSGSLRHALAARGGRDQRRSSPAMSWS